MSEISPFSFCCSSCCWVAVPGENLSSNAARAWTEISCTPSSPTSSSTSRSLEIRKYKPQSGIDVHRSRQGFQAWPVANVTWASSSNYNRKTIFPGCGGHQTERCCKLSRCRCQFQRGRKDGSYQRTQGLRRRKAEGLAALHPFLSSNLFSGHVRTGPEIPKPLGCPRSSRDPSCLSLLKKP